MRPVLFAVFVIFAVSVSAMNLPESRPKRTPIFVGKVVAEVTAIGAKVSRLATIANKVGLVITILQTTYTVYTTVKEKAQELSKDERVHMTLLKFIIELKTIYNSISHALGFRSANKPITSSVQKREINKDNEKLNPELEKLFDDIEALADDIHMKIKKNSLTTEEISKKFKTEAGIMLTEFVHYSDELSKKNVDVLHDEKMKQFLSDILKNLKKISSDVDRYVEKQKEIAFVSRLPGFPSKTIRLH